MKRDHQNHSIAKTSSKAHPFVVVEAVIVRVEENSNKIFVVFGDDIKIYFYKIVIYEKKKKKPTKKPKTKNKNKRQNKKRSYVF